MREHLHGGVSLKPWAGTARYRGVREGEEQIAALREPILEGWKEEGLKKKPRKIRQMSPLKHTE